MQKRIRYSRVDVRTTLTHEDLKRFHEVSVARGLKYTDLAREAINYYLDHWQTDQTNAVENIYAHALKQSTNRICAMLSKVAIDTRAIYRYLGELDEDPERINECRAAAARQISRALTNAEKAVADAMSNQARRHEDDHQT